MFVPLNHLRPSFVGDVLAARNVWWHRRAAGFFTRLLISRNRWGQLNGLRLMFMTSLGRTCWQELHLSHANCFWSQYGVWYALLIQWHSIPVWFLESPSISFHHIVASSRYSTLQQTLPGWRFGGTCRSDRRGTSESGIGLQVFSNWIVYQINSSTLHCRGKNGRSKKIGQTNQKMIHFVPNMYVSGKTSALRPGTQTVMIFGTTKKIRKLPKTTRFQDLRVFACFYRVFAGFLRVFCGVLRVLSPVVWCAANIFWPLSHQIQKHAIKVLKSKI